MTFHEPIDTQSATETDEGPGTAIALMADIDDIVEGRDRAVALYMDLYDQFHAVQAAAASASVGGAISFSTGYNGSDSDEMTRLLLSKGDASVIDENGRRATITGRENYERGLTTRIDRACWTNLMSTLGFDNLLDRQARDEFHASIAKHPPAFTADNARATFGSIWGQRRDLYLRGIANVFMNLDRRFRSHDAFAIGNRIVFERALNEYGGWNDYGKACKRDAIDDVERIFRELDGKGPLDHQRRISQKLDVRENQRPHTYEDEYFRANVFKNGNIHLWMKNKDLLEQVNALLLEYYKPVEGDVTEDGPSYEAGPLFHSTPAKHYGLFPSPPAVVSALLQHADISLKDQTVLEPSAGRGAIAIAARAAGAHVTCVEIQPGLAHELSSVHGLDVTKQGDFLKLRAGIDLPLFDVVLMNPPFDRGRDCDHVRHAYGFLKPGGVLVAVMSARAEHATDARHKALHDLIKQTRDWGFPWRDLPERSFAETGTNVNTVMLRLTKPR